MEYLNDSPSLEQQNDLCRMVKETVKNNADDIKKELEWFKEILKTRSLINCNKSSNCEDIFEIKQPHLNGSLSSYAEFIKKHNLGFEERFILILALTPYIKPELLDVFININSNTQQIYTEFGGRKGKGHNGFLPTGETVMFILAGDNLERRFYIQRFFDNDHIFYKENILCLEDVENGEPKLNGVITVSQDVLDLITFGEIRKPKFSAEFPAKLLTTKMIWDDLILPAYTKLQLFEIETWLKYHSTLMNEWGMERKLKPGYKTLFHGPPGTGKTLTAALLGQKTGADVFRIDLSKIISKYIGETEKNLAKIFDRAESKNWILFFDEADALFGKRTNINDAHDRYANQEVSFLLQRIEDYDGLVILASNYKSNLDDAFMRRFQSMIHFPIPKPDERMQLWKKGFSEKCLLEEKIELNKIASDYELAGGSIINVIHFCSLMALSRDSNIILRKDILEGIKREFTKKGITI